MNEPLNSSQPGITFIGKTYNKHPQWYNQPLRLTKDQKRDPLPVLDDFFECYHLNEVRETLWQWLTGVLSCQRSVAIEPLDSNNYIYFYEKIEGIIEAAYVMKRKMHKHRRWQEKKKFKKNNHSENNQIAEVNGKTHSNEVSTTTETRVNEEVFNKSTQLIEHVDTDPLYEINEVFKNESLGFLRDQLQNWLLVALSADTGLYDEGELRRQLFLLQEQLQILVEALFVIYSRDREKAGVKMQLNEADKPRLLNQDQISNPTQVIAGFFEQFSMVYIIRELDNWLEASICFAGTYPENMSELQALYTHRNILRLVKAANRL
ncbi:hypothetical protein A4D02_35905 [Niastella koreensis]|uniref:Uncharacterized protein n=2 Tax=Niastella koreensis TaxID=354356 RepID=G8THN6_NIAKG|nr:hypothetical protein [Niastella koreensis]AEV97464.1 hypothetical protein Niako_1088 [Niastella koreensis GR20-10]OQP43290.1 hypothetical protein A4D02_35905 [Niastella koreensis]